MAPPARTLPYELIEEIFLRLPPDEPEWLVRASLASKAWLGRLTAPRFQGRYSEFHRAPPMLGFLYSPRLYVSEEPLFISTTKFGACPHNRGFSASDAWDCRHGRVLLGRRDVSPEKLVVLDPITGRQTEQDVPGNYSYRGSATVLYAVNGCDHRACRDGPFRLVFVGLDHDFAAYAYMSLPATGEWSKPSSGLHLGPYTSIAPMPPVLIQDTLYSMLAYADDHVGILKYDMCSKRLSLIDVPLVEENIADTTILMGMEDGSLGFARMDGLTLNLWSRQMGTNGAGWTECRVIDLKELLPDPAKQLRLIGSVEGGDMIIVTTRLGIYKINLNSMEWKKIWKREHFLTLIPYMSFYYPQWRANLCDAVH
ncbi:unnamed protein product [Alopecurus aequalis]